MNIIDLDILKVLKKHGPCDQRILAETSGYSIGSVNRALKVLLSEGLIDEEQNVTSQGRELFRERSPRRAVILAAGFGIRMIPVNLSLPKALLKVRGETLIERQIRLLHEAGIYEIYVVAGYMKERLEFLIDACGVELIVNKDHTAMNNLHSFVLAKEHISNAYIVPCDVYCAEQPFDKDELYSWYGVGDAINSASEVRINRKSELVRIGAGEKGNDMIGIAYITKDDSERIISRAEALEHSPGGSDLFWESALYSANKMDIFARLLSNDSYTDINTCEQLREVDGASNALRREELDLIARVLDAEPADITDTELIKNGVTNRSFLFSCGGDRYILRIAEEGTDKLIDRHSEAAVYELIKGRGLCDNVLFIDPDRGYKLTRFTSGARMCDPKSEEDVSRCMDKLRQLHEMKLSCEHSFDLYGQIDLYEKLRQGAGSVYRDYAETKKMVFALKDYATAHAEEEVLTHADPAADNFLFSPDGEGGEKLQLIDWEYAGMADPHLDIAMFCIDCAFDEEQVDKTIDFYFNGACPDEVRIKIYCYIAACGLLWSNWCEFKLRCGIEFGEYSIRQYRYAKQYYKKAWRLIKNG